MWEHVDTPLGPTKAVTTTQGRSKVRTGIKRRFTNVPATFSASGVSVLNTNRARVNARAVPGRVAIMDELRGTAVNIHVVVRRRTIMVKCCKDTIMGHSLASVVVDDNTVKCSTTTLIVVITPQVVISNQIMPVSHDNCS